MQDEPALAEQDNVVTVDASLGPAAAARVQTRVLLRGIFVILAVAALLWAIYSLRGVILLVVLALFFSYFIAPLVEMVRRPFIARGRERFMPRALAIGIIYLLLFGAGAIVFNIVVPRVGNQVMQFARQSPTYLAHARDRLATWKYLMDLDRFPVAFRDAADKTMAGSIAAAEEHATSGVVAMLQLAGYLPWLILIPILAFFLLKDAETFRRNALRALPMGHLRGRGANFFQDVNRTLAAYIRAQLLACVLIGTVCSGGFVLLGVPYALMLGFFAGLLEFIPLVGPLVLACVASVIASFDSLGQAFSVLLFLAVLRIIHDYVVYPRLMGRGVHLHPLAIILAILCGAELGGIAGIFLAIPATAVLSVGYRHWLEFRGSEGIVAELLTPAPPAVLDATTPPEPMRPTIDGHTHA